MKTILATLTMAAVAAFGQSTTPEVLTGTGTITEYEPGTSLVIQEEDGAMTYRYAETVTYATRKGQTLTAEEAKARLHVGAPVSVGYTVISEERVISRVEIDDEGPAEIE